MNVAGRAQNPADQKEMGRHAILDAIRAAGRVARIDIAEATGLSPATVTAATSELMAAGLIEETPADGAAGAAKRGRPRVLLKLRGAAHRIAGLKIAQKSISVLVTDFEGTEITRHHMPLPEPRMSAALLADQILAAITGACEQAGLDLDDLSGVAIAMAGQMDAPRNFVYWSSSLTERNQDFDALLGPRLPCPVFIDNDANLVAKAEHLFGEGRGLRDFLVVTIEHGVGLGIVLGGRLYRGARGCGAEFGHTKVQLDGALCQCGQRGCLEAYVGDYALIRDSGLQANEGVPDVSAVFAAAREGDAKAQQVLDRAGQMFAIGLANLVNIFDPQLVILSGAQTSFDHLNSPAVIEHMKRSVLQVDAPPPEIRVHHWGDIMWSRGAAAYGIEQVSALAIRDLARHAD